MRIIDAKVIKYGILIELMMKNARREYLQSRIKENQGSKMMIIMMIPKQQKTIIIRWAF